MFPLRNNKIIFNFSLVWSPGIWVSDYEYEGGIEKFVLRITDWHHEACRVMTNGDRKEQIFLSHPHTNNGFFSCSLLKYRILYWKP